MAAGRKALQLGLHLHNSPPTTDATSGKERATVRRIESERERDHCWSVEGSFAGKEE